jgi:uncharacterized DUF497 family protein
MILTKHARERMAERGISEAEVFGIFADPNHVITKSQKDDFLAFATGKVGERTLTALYHFMAKYIITVRVASRKEKKEYDTQSK